MQAVKWSKEFVDGLLTDLDWLCWTAAAPSDFPTQKRTEKFLRLKVRASWEIQYVLVSITKPDQPLRFLTLMAEWSRTLHQGTITLISVLLLSNKPLWNMLQAKNLQALDMQSFHVS